MAKGFQDRRYRQLIERLVMRRKELKLSQQALADRLGSHQQHISRFETGERRLDVVEFWDVATALGVDASELVGTLGAP